jgi:hypothetical protein
MGGVVRSVKKHVRKLAGGSSNSGTSQTAAVSSDGAARTVDEETIGKDDERKDKRKRTSKGKLKVPMTAKQSSTGLKA